MLVGTGNRLVAPARTTGERRWSREVPRGRPVTPIDGALYLTDGGTLAGFET